MTRRELKTYVTTHLQALASEILAWRASGTLEDGKTRGLAKSLDPDADCRLVELEIAGAALEAVTQAPDHRTAEVLVKLDKHLIQMAPHVAARETARLLVEARNELERLTYALSNPIHLWPDRVGYWWFCDSHGPTLAQSYTNTAAVGPRLLVCMHANNGDYLEDLEPEDLPDGKFKWLGATFK